jgi:phosphoglycerate kinase
MAKLSVRDLSVRGKRVLVRVDFNVPLEARDGEQVVTDDTRLQGALPTIQHLRQQGAKVILMSHLGRPKGEPVPKYSLHPVARRLSELLETTVVFVEATIGKVAETIVAGLRDGDVAVLENLRFHKGEEKNDPVFAHALARLGDLYVNDAFGAAHRAHASTAGITEFLRPAAAGLLMENELRYLREELQNPRRPFVVVLGGAKVSDKITVIDALLEKADALLIGGAMAYTFELAQGRAVGNSLVEPDKVSVAQAALAKAAARGVRFLLPVDGYIVEQIDFPGRTVSKGRYTLPGEQIPPGWAGVDIGPETLKIFRRELSRAQTILWNGPMGIFEIPSCATGTFAIARAVADNRSARSIIGGGDSVKAVRKAGVADKMSFISTGGGASLELLEGRELPGIAVLNDA